MKSRLIIGMLSGMLLALSGRCVFSQTPSGPPANPPINNRPVLVQPTPATDRPDLPKRPERPQVAGQPVQTQQMKDLVRDFQSARQAFLKQQQELNRQLKTANTAQRALIRAQLKENLQQWTEQQRAQIQDVIAQAREMRSNFREVIESGKGDGRSK